jgi:hypothetical protein
MAAADAQPAQPSAPARQQLSANDNAQGQDASLAQQVLGDEEQGIPEVDELQQQIEEDEAAPQTDPLDEDVGGLKMRDLIESLKQGVIPKELHDKMQFEIDVNGVSRVMTATELGKGYMRQADYTRGKQEVAEGRRENESFTESFNKLMDGARNDPKAYQKIMRRMGLGQAFFAAAQELATDMDRIMRLPPHEQEREWELRKLREEREELLEKQAMNRETEQAQKKRRMQEKFKREFEEFLPVAFQRAGNLARTAYNEKVYVENLRALKAPGEPLTLELCTQAAQATIEQLGDEARENQAAIAARAKASGAGAGSSPAAQQIAQVQQAAQQPRRQLPPRPGAAGAPMSGGAKGPSQGGGISDFRNYLKSRSGR